MNIAYLRTSTGKQDGEGQRNTILEWAAKEGVKIDKWESETISSKTKRENRKITPIIQVLGKGDRIIVSELSRLARSMTELMALVQEIREAGASIEVVSDGMTLTPEDGWQVSAYLMAISMGAEIEREMVSQRTKAALAAKKREGVILGRPKGRSKLEKHDEQIRELQDKGVTIANIARILEVSRSTLYNYLKNRRAQNEKSKGKKATAR